jgi:hypothetical protein|tara:strand:+ start:395 stop:574 length:180 start_codon:yes stop_codon:yes gene_type:complete
MSKWELILKKSQGNIIIDYFNNKEEAEEELEYRETLCRHMGYSPDIPYSIRKSISKNKK